MLVNQVMTENVASCRPDDHLHDVVRMFRDHDCGCIPVVEERLGVVGVITDRDVCLAALDADRPLGELVVSKAMSRHVQTCNAADPVSAAQEAMQRRQVRRLPVVDESNHLVGMLSLNDLAREAVRDGGSKAGTVTREEIADTLAAICGRRVLAAHA